MLLMLSLDNILLTNVRFNWFIHKLTNTFDLIYPFNIFEASGTEIATQKTIPFSICGSRFNYKNKTEVYLKQWNFNPAI